MMVGRNLKIGVETRNETVDSNYSDAIFNIGTCLRR
jgi:hypothetical protein